MKKNIYWISALIACLIREDWVYVDDQVERISLTRHEGYLTFSEKFRLHFGNRYICSATG